MCIRDRFCPGDSASQVRFTRAHRRATSGGRAGGAGRRGAGGQLNNVLIRPAILSEQKALEALQLRASLSNAGDREALLANPDAIELPLAQIAAGRVFVAERDGAIVGFAAVLPRNDRETELDGLFVERCV